MKKTTVWFLLLGHFLLLLVQCAEVAPALAGIEPVFQEGRLESDGSGRPSSSSVWIDLRPTLVGQTLRIPAWTFYYRRKSYPVPAAEIPLSAGSREAQLVVVYLAAGDRGAEYVLVEGPEVSQRDRLEQARLRTGAAEPIAVIWFQRPSGAQSPGALSIHVLKHTQSSGASE